MQNLKIHNLGPIKDCQLNIADFMVFTGEQTSGKSTVAKSVFFFKSIPSFIETEVRKKQIDRAAEQISADRSIRSLLIKNIRLNFLRTFGSSWCMEADMSLAFSYRDGISICVSLKDANVYGSTNYIWVDLSPELERFLESMDISRIADPAAEIRGFFDQLADVVYIPAGRSMLTLLSNQLWYIYGLMDDAQKKDLDYCTQSYLELILKLKPYFSDHLPTLIEDTISIDDTTADKEVLSHAREMMDAIMYGEYRYVNGEERLFITDDKYVKINYASSGQQEAVWILNVLFYYLLNHKKAYFIIEEPESHLYPNVQKQMAEFIALVNSNQNSILLTTHSPYILGSLNNLLYAGELSATADRKQLDKIIPSDCWLCKDLFRAYNMEDGKANSCMDSEGSQIMNEVIDGASECINGDYEKMLRLIYEEK